jgi:hypothetical protein
VPGFTGSEERLLEAISASQQQALIRKAGEAP